MKSFHSSACISWHCLQQESLSDLALWSHAGESTHCCCLLWSLSYCLAFDECDIKGSYFPPTVQSKKVMKSPYQRLWAGKLPDHHGLETPHEAQQTGLTRSQEVPSSALSKEPSPWVSCFTPAHSELQCQGDDSCTSSVWNVNQQEVPRRLA